MSTSTFGSNAVVDTIIGQEMDWAGQMMHLGYICKKLQDLSEIVSPCSH